MKKNIVFLFLLGGFLCSCASNKIESKNVQNTSAKETIVARKFASVPNIVENFLKDEFVEFVFN